MSPKLTSFAMVVVVAAATAGCSTVDEQARADAAAALAAAERASQAAMRAEQAALQAQDAAAQAQVSAERIERIYQRGLRK